MPDFIQWKLTGAKPATDFSVASRTLLFDQLTQTWSDQLLCLLEISLDQLPQIYPSGTVTGKLSKEAAANTGLPAGIPVVSGGHDHLCAAYACGATGSRAAVDSSGSSSSIIFLQDRFISNPAFLQQGYACYHYLTPGLFLTKAGLKSSGSAVDWLIRLVNSVGDIDPTNGMAAMDNAARISCARKAGPVWLPHLMGSGTPEGNRLSLAGIAGLEIQHDASDLYRGLLESLAFWTRQNLNGMQKLTGLTIQKIILTGGLHRSDLLCQLKAALSQASVYRPSIPESAAVGAALLAAFGAGYLPDIFTAPDCLTYSADQFDPDPAWSAWYDQMYNHCYLPLYPALEPIHKSIHQINTISDLQEL